MGITVLIIGVNAIARFAFTSFKDFWNASFWFITSPMPDFSAFTAARIPANRNTRLKVCLIFLPRLAMGLNKPLTDLPTLENPERRPLSALAPTFFTWLKAPDRVRLMDAPAFAAMLLTDSMDLLIRSLNPEPSSCGEVGSTDPPDSAGLFALSCSLSYWDCNEISRFSVLLNDAVSLSKSLLPGSVFSRAYASSCHRFWATEILSVRTLICC